LATKDEQRKTTALTDILVDADRLETWIRQYLANTQSEIQKDGVADIVVAIRQSVNNLESAFRRHGIRATLNLDSGLPGVRPSTLTLVQVLNGLVANAIEAMPNGGEISIVAKAEDGGDRVRILVDDTGPGLPDTGKASVFEPFTTTKSSGFGLGLPLARRIVTRYGGQLTLANKPEGGLSVTLLFPAVS
jgi:two-component system sensor histidine kinase HydH